MAHFNEPVVDVLSGIIWCERKRNRLSFVRANIFIPHASNLCKFSYASACVYERVWARAWERGNEVVNSRLMTVNVQKRTFAPPILARDLTSPSIHDDDDEAEEDWKWSKCWAFPIQFSKRTHLYQSVGRFNRKVRVFRHSFTPGGLVVSLSSSAGHSTPIYLNTFLPLFFLSFVMRDDKNALRIIKTHELRGEIQYFWARREIDTPTATKKWGKSNISLPRTGKCQNYD